MMKKWEIFQKIAKIRDKKNLEKHSIISINCAITYYQTLEEVPWPLRSEKTKNMTKKFQN